LINKRGPQHSDSRREPALPETRAVAQFIRAERPRYVSLHQPPHGIKQTVRAARGRHRYCVIVANVGAGAGSPGRAIEYAFAPGRRVGA
jgi:hypothetical protein